jgi:predicted metal-dependent enzyme (double-stranded beta helix superfamily)
MFAPSISATLAEALNRVLVRIRAVEQSGGIDGTALIAMGAALIATGTRVEGELVSIAEATRLKGWGHLLSVDADHRFALYLVSEKPGEASPPHEHMTWQVTACLQGEELHRLYQPSDVHRRTARAYSDAMLRRGSYTGMLADEVHSTRVVSPVPTLSLQVYGRDVAQMPEFSLRTFREESG